MRCGYHSIYKCQFDVPDDELYELPTNPSQYRCIFHLGAESVVGHKFDKRKWGPTDKDKFKIKLFEYIKTQEEDSETVNLAGTVFPEDIDFSDHIFTTKVQFKKAAFWGNAKFKNVIFKDIVRFEQVEFKSNVSFDGCQFNSVADFSNAESGGAYFSRSLFNGHASFNDLTVSDIKFTKVEFKDSAEFGESCYGYAHFLDTTFWDDVGFASAIVNDTLIFDNVVFHKETDMSVQRSDALGGNDSKYDFNYVRIVSTTFKDRITFNNRKFNNTTQFTGSIFMKAPHFHNCELHQDTDFTEAQFLDISGDAARAYRTLKLAMEKSRSRIEEGMFYALEQRSMRNHKSIGFWPKTFSWLYDVFSGYGQSIGRPLLSLTTITALSGLVYAMWASPSLDWSKKIDWDLVVNGMLFSVEQVIRPFWVWSVKSGPDWFSGNWAAVKVVATIQSVSFLAVFALLILVLRWWFKRG